MITPHQACYFAHQLTRQGEVGELDQISSTLFDSKVDLNPHQVDAALFALANPLQKGVLLADEVGLGKTIEAGLVLCQKWAERKRKLLVVAPAHIRKQWQAELSEKFNLPSVVIDRRVWNRLRRDGNPNPFDCGKIAIVSYGFASRMKEELRSIPFDLVVLDEAHKLRNAYQPSRKGGQAIRWAFELRQKLLLTATPLQNSLMELYGLGWFIGDHVFGDKSSFQSRYCNAGGDVVGLRSRLGQLCKRTLRKQCPYVNYTKRQAITHPFAQTSEEKRLNEDVTKFMDRESSYAFPLRQRYLIEMILFKTLASSPQALASTLRTMKARLEKIRDGLSDEDFERFVDDISEDDLDIEGLLDQLDVEEEGDDPSELPLDPRQLSQELEELESLIKRADSITNDSKSKALVKALEVAFDRLHELGAAKKALIFTESRKTQEFLANHLESNGYSGKVVVFNGSNSHPNAKRAYENYVERHRGTDRLTGSKTIDVRSALIEEFRDHGEILLATEAAAEGVNLQFCSLVVNYDLPWNPQRIEQRIGRCHRYGQKYDVVVVNFLSQDNLADRRVQDLLQQKFTLFDGLFGASDEVLGTIEDGIDFEKRVIGILKTCRTDAEINEAFDKLQQELESTISEKMTKAREQLLEHFDADVHDRLNVTAQDARLALDRVGERLWKLTCWGLRGAADFNSDTLGFTLPNAPAPEIPTGRYQLISVVRDQENGAEPEAHLLRLSSPLGQWLLSKAKEQELNRTLGGTDASALRSQVHESPEPTALAAGTTDSALAPRTPDASACGSFDCIEFDVTGNERKISMLADFVGQSGWMRVDKLSLDSDAIEEFMLLTAFTTGGQNLDQELADRLFDVAGKHVDEVEMAAADLERINADANRLKNATIARASENGNTRFRQAQEQVNQWADDKITAAELQLDTLRRELRAARRQADLAENIQAQETALEEIRQLEAKRRKARRNIDDVEEAVEQERQKLLAQLRSRCQQKQQIETLFTIRFTIK
ncbi:DEAD/DEAH box helicase [Stieleria sp. ICT_E10.1]|uniref:DEAD/DEAH box helicase n=1 Tax=Stieleria sedimenti TaxID=2976331 RepID=UPI002180752C|nr:DEAD/DEAH box helicase [Stieleria sedimenti]MCS7466458.1 DEAD/DEAH box helicase [Stieleria sedimenti]